MSSLYITIRIHDDMMQSNMNTFLKMDTILIDVHVSSIVGHNVIKPTHKYLRQAVVATIVLKNFTPQMDSYNAHTSEL